MALHDDAEATLAFQHLAAVMTHRQRLGDLIDIRHAEAIAGELATFRNDPQVFEAGDLLDANVHGSGDGANSFGDLASEAGELVEVSPVDDGCDV
jgi:hypothetical protein